MQIESIKFVYVDGHPKMNPYKQEINYCHRSDFESFVNQLLIRYRTVVQHNSFSDVRKN